MISLIDKVGIWHGMPQDTAEQMVWADNYYDSELIPLAQKSFCLRYEEQAQGADYYGMFILLGDDWAKSAFIVRLLAPQNIHILYQKHHARQYSVLLDNLALEPDRIVCTEFSDGGYASVCRCIQRQADIWSSVGSMAIDITGGSLQSATAAAMMAGRCDIDLYRLDAHTERGALRHDPGTEELLSYPRLSSIFASK